MKLSRVLLAAPRSGSGKTMICCGLLAAWKKRNLQVRGFKCGPDYIDPLFHRRVLGIPTGNLDSFFMEKKDLLRIFAKESEGCDLCLLEGVMGYYDGIACTTSASSAEIAHWTKTPTILVLDCKGMSASIGAELKGFLTYKEEWKEIKGVIFNRLPESLYEPLAEMAKELGVQPLGYLPNLSVGHLESRHLGLVTPMEIQDFQEKMNQLADEMEKTLDMEGILELAKQAEDLPIEEESVKREHSRRKLAEQEDIECEALGREQAGREEIKDEKLRIALAEDEAFCFFYQENRRFLEEAGVELVTFSPLHDKELPENCQGLILTGGYPELYAKELAANTSMKESIQSYLQKGGYCIAECGGFLYLHHSLETQEKESHPMIEFYQENCFYKGFNRRFGYLYLETKKDSLFGPAGQKLRGHEFHYFESENPGEDFMVKKPLSDRNWEEGRLSERIYAGFAHLHYYGSKEAILHFIEKCREEFHDQALPKP